MKKKSDKRKSGGNQVAVKSLSHISDISLLTGCLVVTLLAFLNVLKAGYVNWDDQGYLWLNKLIQPISFKSLKGMFTGHTCGNYSPLVVFTYSIEHIVAPNWDTNSWLFHFTNVLFHVGTTAAVFVFLRSLGLRNWGLGLATLLFGIHPMRVESVAWVTERKDVMYGLFYVLALWQYWLYLKYEARKKNHFTMTIVFGLLSMFSKIQAVALPLSLMVMDYYANRKILNIKTIVEKIPFFILSLIFGLVGLHFLSQSGGFAETGYNSLQRIFFSLHALVMYFVRLVLPFGLSTYYPYPNAEQIPVSYYLSPLILIAVAYLVWRSSRTTKVISFGILFFLVNIIFVLQAKGAGKAFMADRFTYIPYLGLFFIAGYYFNRILNEQWWPALKKLARPVVTGFLLLCLVLTYKQNSTWHDSVALWTNVCRQFPNEGMAWSNKGLAYDDLKDYTKSVETYKAGIAAEPAYYDAAYNLGSAYYNLGDMPHSLEGFSYAVKIRPERPDAYEGRAKTYMRIGNADSAIADYNKAIELSRRSVSADYFRGRGAALAEAKRFTEAIVDYDSALNINKKADYYFMKANSLAQLNRLDEALALYDETLKLEPQFSDAFNNKGNCYIAMKKFPEAIREFDKAVAIEPGAIKAIVNRGLAKSSVGDKAGACADWQAALKLGALQVSQLLADNCR